MARKIKAKLMMELREQGVSRRSIARTRRMSMESVCDVFDIADERGITWAQVEGMTDDEVYRLFYPDKHVRESVFEEPDWDYVHKEMAKGGVNLRLLHDEYKADCARQHKVAMGYTRWCERYADYTVANSLTKRIEHKAGVSCEVDWSGPTMSLSIRKSTLRYVDNRRFDSEHADRACKWRDLRPGGRAVPPQNGIPQSSSNSFRREGSSPSPTSR